MLTLPLGSANYSNCDLPMKTLALFMIPLVCNGVQSHFSSGCSVLLTSQVIQVSGLNLFVSSSCVSMPSEPQECFLTARARS